MGTSVGYMHPTDASIQAPSYEEICEGTTGFIEVAHVLFDNSKASFEDLARHFFTFHDPTTFERQGNDTGSQYTSIIFYHNDEQKNISEKTIEQVQSLIDQGHINKFETNKVSTAVRPFTKYFEAEDYH